MEKDFSISASNNSSCNNEEDAEKSFVGKFKSIINNTPLSKWFRKQDDSSSSRSTIRRRGDEDDVEDDEVRQMQPPSKRAKLPLSQEVTNSVIFHTSNSFITNNVSGTNNKVINFPEPVAGPSGIKSRKLLTSATNSIPASSVKNDHFDSSELLNGHKDSDSEESTSGYSSVARIGSKEHVCQSQESSKQASPTAQNNATNNRSLFQNTSIPLSRSLFTDTLSPNTSMTSRRPKFNASTFGSPNFIDKTIATEKIINSPFYNGRTIYGGASAYGRQLGRRTHLPKKSKAIVQIKPMNKSDNVNLMLGKTARRILETLEQYSSPVNDAKKIPIANSSTKRFRASNGYDFSSISKTPSSRELQVPELLKMKQKLRLQESTETVRQIAISSKSDLNAEIRTESVEKGVEDKCRTEVAKKRKLDANEDVVTTKTSPVKKLEVVAPQPVATTEKKSSPVVVSKSNSIAPPPTSFTSFKAPSLSPQVAVVTKNKDTATTNSTTTMLFKFSDPLVISENLKSIVAVNNFKFSEPLCKNGENKNFKTASKATIDQKSTQEPKQDSKKSTGGFGENFKMSSDKWECEACMVRNKIDDDKCVACTTPKPSLKPPGVAKASVTPILSSFGDKFKPPSDKWECQVCLIRNDQAVTKCVACETPRKASTISATTLSATTSNNTWECSTCLIKNKVEQAKCAACESPKPVSNLAGKFAIKEDEWECKVCMVRNKMSNVKCQCCEAVKPGAGTVSKLDVDKKTSSSTLKFSFGIDKAAATSFTFGIPPTTEAPKAVAVPAFSFGAPPAAAEAKKEATKPEQKKDEVVAVAPALFKFGVAAPQVDVVKSKDEDKVLQPVTTAAVAAVTTQPKFSFGSIMSNKQSSGDKGDTGALSKEAASAPPAAKLFNFGQAKSSAAALVAPNKDVAELKDVTKPTTFTFAANKPTSDGAPSLFGSPKPPSATVNTNSNGFGATSTTTVGGNKPSFELPSNTVAQAKSFAFGAAATTTTAATAVSTVVPSVVGEPGTVKAPPFVFAQSQNSGGFSFGATGAAKAETKAPVFNFASGVTGDSAFNSASSSSLFGAVSKSATFNFGSTLTTTSPAARAGFSFGAPAGNSGSTSTTTAVAPSFNFGGAAAAPSVAPSGGFNFSAVASFGPGKPSFNFTDGSVTSFSAQPLADGGASAPRKIKKAVRRSQR